MDRTMVLTQTKDTASSCFMRVTDPSIEMRLLPTCIYTELTMPPVCLTTELT